MCLATDHDTEHVISTVDQAGSYTLPASASLKSLPRLFGPPVDSFILERRCVICLSQNPISHVNHDMHSNHPFAPYDPLSLHLHTSVVHFPRREHAVPCSSFQLQYQQPRTAEGY
jgi:hypothetical protein